jgi:hypothetical protein
MINLRPSLRRVLPGLGPRPSLLCLPTCCLFTASFLAHQLVAGAGADLCEGNGGRAFPLGLWCICVYTRENGRCRARKA